MHLGCRSVRAAAAASLLVAVGAPARAAVADGNVVDPTAAASSAPEAGAKPERLRRAHVEWDAAWPRFRWWEYGGVAGTYALSWYVRRYEGTPDRASWQGKNPFDDTIRGWLRGGSSSTRLSVGRFSDWVVLFGSVYPFAVDLPVVTLVHRRPEVAWQMLMMNLEAYAVSGLISNTLFYFVGRARPNRQECDANPGYDPICGGIGNNASFPSGHVQTIATAAGLTCAHHSYLPIYGADAADAGGCALLSAATAVTGVARIVADRHNASDVLMGGLIGFGAGYGLPWLLHYRYDGRMPRAAILPVAGPDTVGLSVVGLAPL